MSEYKFLFDLDSTLTKEEILPTVSAVIGRREDMQELTEKTMLGDIPFEQSFQNRVEILKDVSVLQVQEMIAGIPLLEELQAFLRENRERCFVVTSNLDVWIIELMKRMGMENNFYSSKAIVEDNKILRIEHILSKSETVEKIGGKTVAIGDGNNDAEMIRAATIGIGFGGVRPVAPSVLAVSDYVVYNESKLIELLKSFL